MLLRDGVVPTVDDYQARRAATTSGDAPAASKLIVAYGHWLAACNAAYRLLGRRAAAGLADLTPPPDPPGVHAAGDLDAIDGFHHRCGIWPHQWEFLERDASNAPRRVGARDPRIPTAPSPACEGVRHLCAPHRRSSGATTRLSWIRIPARVPSG